MELSSSYILKSFVSVHALNDVICTLDLVVKSFDDFFRGIISVSSVPGGFSDVTSLYRN